MIDKETLEKFEKIVKLYDEAIAIYDKELKEFHDVAIEQAKLLHKFVRRQAVQQEIITMFYDDLWDEMIKFVTLTKEPLLKYVEQNKAEELHNSCVNCVNRMNRLLSDSKEIHNTLDTPSKENLDLNIVKAVQEKKVDDKPEE